MIRDLRLNFYYFSPAFILIEVRKEVFLKFFFSQEYENQRKIQKTLTIFLQRYSGPFATILKKRNNHREESRTGRNIQIFINSLIPTSFNSAYIVLENVYERYQLENIHKPPHHYHLSSQFFGREENVHLQGKS